METSEGVMMATMNDVASVCLGTCDFIYDAEKSRSTVATWPERGSTLDNTEVRVAVSGVFDITDSQVWFGTNECAVGGQQYMEEWCGVASYEVPTPAACATDDYDDDSYTYLAALEPVDAGTHPTAGPTPATRHD